jgi:hypothetical protein
MGNVEIKREEYITRLQSAIETSYKCRAAYRRTVVVREKLPQEWSGQVEIFWLTGHPSAKRCFAWLEESPGKPAESKVIAILEVPPVIGPATAIRAALSAR